MTGRQPPGLLAAGGVVVLFGDHAKHALLITRFMIERQRKRHLPHPPEWDELADALTAALAACPQCPRTDTAAPVELDTEKVMTTTELARRDGCTPRHARRMATQLDGQKIGGRWFVPTAAVNEHLEGKLCPDS
ncbi:MAG: helix-turn-helix domain-containing protein [Mycobacterium sp.]